MNKWTKAFRAARCREGKSQVWKWEMWRARGYTVITNKARLEASDAAGNATMQLALQRGGLEKRLCP